MTILFKDLKTGKYTITPEMGESPYPECEIVYDVMNFIKEFNGQLSGKELSLNEQQEIFRLATNLFRNRFYEAPNFDVDTNGKIILIEDEV